MTRSKSVIGQAPDQAKYQASQAINGYRGNWCRLTIPTMDPPSQPESCQCSSGAADGQKK